MIDDLLLKGNKLIIPKDCRQTMLDKYMKHTLVYKNVLSLLAIEALCFGLT